MLAIINNTKEAPLKDTIICSRNTTHSIWACTKLNNKVTINHSNSLSNDIHLMLTPIKGTICLNNNLITKPKLRPFIRCHHLLLQVCLRLKELKTNNSSNSSSKLLNLKKMASELSGKS